MGFFDSVKKMANDKFLQKVVCSCCQNEVKIMNTNKLADGNLVCNQCLNRIPEEFGFSPDTDTMERLKKIIDYMVYSHTELKPIFKSSFETQYKDFEFDPVRGLFRVGYSSDLYFKLSDITLFDMRFVPKEYKEKVLSVNKCYIFGDVVLQVMVGENDLVPSAFYSETVAYNEVATGVKKGILDPNFVIDDPPDLADFLARIAPYINL